MASPPQPTSHLHPDGHARLPSASSQSQSQSQSQPYSPTHTRNASSSSSNPHSRPLPQPPPQVIHPLPGISQKEEEYDGEGGYDPEEALHLVHERPSIEEQDEEDPMEGDEGYLSEQERARERERLMLQAERDGPTPDPYATGLASDQPRTPRLEPQPSPHVHYEPPSSPFTHPPHPHPVNPNIIYPTYPPDPTSTSAGASLSPEISPALLAIDEKTHQRFLLDQRRRRALLDLDEAGFSKFHVRTVLVAGAGFFTDAYDIFAISVSSVMLGLVYNNGSTSLGAGADLGLKVATPIGNLFGQTLFGWMADVYGRKKMYGIELVIIITATLVQAMAAQGPDTAVTITGVLVFWRFVMGVGIGGDYPLSAIITSEFAATRIRGRMMGAVFAMQGFGTLTATVVALVCVAAFHNQIESSGAAGVDPCWRLVIGLGCVPAVFALYFRLSIPESPRFTMDVERNVVAAMRESERFMRTAGYRDERDQLAFANALRAEAPRMSWADFRAYFGQWRNGRILLGTAYSWFALDIAFYGLGFNSSILLNTIGFRWGPSCAAGETRSNPNDCMYSTVWSISLGSVILAAAGLIPGFIASFFLVDVVGRKPLQLIGFALMTAILAVMGFAYWMLQAHASTWFVVLFVLANFMANAGPNTTTFIIPGEVFPTRYRSTAHGISAACGKLGAVIAQIIFSRLQDLGGAPGSGNWIGHILQIFAFFMLTGVFSTLLLPETKRKSLEELSNENQENFIYDLHEVRLPEEALLHGQPDVQTLYAVGLASMGMPVGNGHAHQPQYTDHEPDYYPGGAAVPVVSSGAVVHDTSVYARGRS